MDFATTFQAWSYFIVLGKALHQLDLEQFLKWPLAAAGDRQATGSSFIAPSGDYLERAKRWGHRSPLPDSTNRCSITCVAQRYYAHVATADNSCTVVRRGNSPKNPSSLSSPALRMAVPALLVVGLCDVAAGTDFIRQVGPEPLGLLQLHFDVDHLPRGKTEH